MHVLLVRLLQGAACAVAVVLFKVLQFLLKCYQSHRKYLASPIPGPPTSNKILGHIPDIYGPKGIWVISDWCNTYGPLYKVHFLQDCVLVLTDPEAIARITRRTGPGPYLPKPRAFYESLETAVKPKLPNILTVEDGDYWKAVRQGAAPCFSVTNMKQVLPLVLELTKRVTAGMADTPLVDVTDGAKRITSDIMGVLLLGEDLGGTLWKPSEYLDCFYPVLQAQGLLMNNPYHLWQLWRADVRHARACIDRHSRIMDEKVARLMESPPPEHTIAAHLLRVKDPATGQCLTPNQLKVEIAIFMAAGFETTSHAITWGLALLASHPEVQEELYQELVAAGIAPAADGRSAGRDIEASDLGRLPLLSAVIKESLRLCPPAPFGGSRMCPSDGADLCGYKVDKGTVVMMCPLPLALAKHTFGPDAAEFRPQRWLDNTPSSNPAASEQDDRQDDTAPQRDTVSRAPPALTKAEGRLAAAAGGGGGGGGGFGLPNPLTFMTGPRDCIGQNLAKMELQVVLATLLSSFKFSPGPDLQKELEVAAATGQPRLSAIHALAGVFVTLQPLSGKMVLQVQPRSHRPAAALVA